MDKSNNKKIKVLIVDDDEEEFIITRNLFREIGDYYELKFCLKFEEGLNEILKSEYDVCLLDYHMGAHNGVEFIKEVVSRVNTTPIILLTGQGDRTIDYESMEAGASDYLQKIKLDSETLERTIRYILERKKSEEKIRYLAYYDQLTNLPNRTLFFDRLNTAMAIAKRHNRLCAVMFIDIDDFKRINDSLGHAIGDLLIKEIGIRLLTCIRKEDAITRDRFVSMLDTVARLGGDEFTILLSEILLPENASKVADRIRNTLIPPVELNGIKVNITLSIGISIYPADGNNLETLIKNADIAMYNAKHSGKNNFQYFNQSMNNMALHKLNIESELINAIKNNDLSLCYLPLMDVKSKKLMGIETLLSWQHPVKGFIPQNEYIHIAEETGLIIAIGSWVLDTAFSNIKKWNENGLPKINLSIHISPKQLNQKDFIDSITGLKMKHNISLERLTFEITESGIINNFEKAISVISSIQSLGIKMALDDFGSGNTSFAVLRQINFDVLKIDQSFFKKIPESPADTAIVSSLISIGHNMNMEIIAEGIENKEQLKFLEANGCDKAQGSLFGKPLTEDEMVKMI